MLAALQDQEHLFEEVDNIIPSPAKDHLARFRVTSVVQAKQTFEAERALMETPGLQGGDVIELNVGGVSMSTTRNTLTQVA